MPGAPSAGVLGLGIIGSRVAARVATAGIPLAVWNRTARDWPDLPAPCASPAAVAELADVLQIFVADDEALRSTIAALLPALSARHVLLSHATVSPGAVREAADVVSPTGAALLDAPFTGSRDAAAQGKITYYIGGDPAALDKARPVLDASARAILRIGGIGSASIVKIATNVMAAAAAVSLAEAVNLLRANGVDPSILPEVLETNAARSGVTDLKLPCMLGGDFAPRFSGKNMHKDMRLAAVLAGGKAPLTAAMERLYDETCQRGFGEEDFASVVKTVGT